MFPASMWERRVWREGPHHWSDPLIIWYIVYRVNAGREVTVARGITKHATPGEIYRKIRQARAAMLPLVQVLAAGSQPTKFTDRPPDDNYSRFVDPLSACVESYVERRVVSFPSALRFLRSRRCDRGCVVVWKRRIARTPWLTRHAALRVGPRRSKNGREGLDSLSFYGRGVHFSAPGPFLKFTFDI